MDPACCSQPFPFLDLPAELRLEIYELLLVGSLLHVNMDINIHEEGEDETGRDGPLRITHCQANLTEDGAYERSVDESLNEQSDPPQYTDTWRYGDPFHIDCCILRHRNCQGLLPTVDLNLL